MPQGFDTCVSRDNKDVHETGVARIDYVNDTNGELFYVLLTFFSMFLLMAIDFRNRYRFRKSDGKTGGSTVILPGYFTYLTSVAIVNLILGVVFLTSYLAKDHFGRWTNLTLMSIQFGFTHFFYETPTFFFLCNGAGRRDMHWALRGGGAAGVVAFLFLFIAGYYGLIKHCHETPFFIFITFRLSIILFYTLIVFAPPSLLYQRPALTPYSRFMVVYNVGWLFVNFSLFYGPDYFYCSAYFLNFVFDGLFPPLVIYYALVCDSQYWQGFLSTDNNPLSGLWDVNSEVVSAMATSISQPSTVTEKRIPVIHYGMLNIDLSAGFTAGGFSRVYIADFRKRRVAVKLLFAMELNPKSIVNFYKEAQILQDLQSEYVVECIGITIMPPALGVIMEYCQNGSLFDYLYRNEFSTQLATVRDAHNTCASNMHFTIARNSMHLTSRTVDFTTNSSVISSFSISDGANKESAEEIGEAAKTPKPINSSLLWNKLGSTHTSNSPTNGVSNVLVENARDTTFSMMLDAASGVEFLHSKGFMHCDIKSLNFLVTADLRVKLSDLGEARPILGPEDDRKAVAGQELMICPCPAVNWCPPECLSPTRSGATYTPSSDVFSLTMVLCEILTKTLPLDDEFPRLSHFDWFQLIVDQKKRPSLPEDTPAGLVRCFESGWNTDPAQRLSAKDIVCELQSIITDLRGTSNVGKLGMV